MMSHLPLVLAATAGHALPSPWMVLPFLILLLCIALMPLFAPHFWEHHYPKVAIGLGLITASYYLFVLHDSLSVQHAMMEYVGFMALIGSLYVISGGINIGVKGEATPLRNILFLLFGACIANVIGTTGASMLLIRPWIRMNKYRITAYHVVFFIFIVSNCGGLLTPIGDPPLFLGYLRGVPFWWVFDHVWVAWVQCIALLLAIFYVIDAKNFKRAPKEIATKETAKETWSIRGVPNLLFLAVVIVGVFLPQTWKIEIGHFSVTFGSLLMVAAAAASYYTTPKPVHEANDFNFHPVQEVGYLFIGIFLAMMPALQLLQSGSGLSLSGPVPYFFASGALSAFLDNAPTYLAFLAMEMGSFQLDVGNPEQVRQFLEVHPGYVVAISMGAVLFGAASYIGNGPNFMVKSIAEKMSVKTPSFLGYIFIYSLPYLVPVLALVGWLTLRKAW